MNKSNNELLKIIAENPNHELMFFVADRPCEYQWTSCEINHINLTAMALYNDEIWLDEEDYEDKLYDVLSDEYKTNETLKEAVDCKIAMTKFKDYICVYLS